MAEAPDNKIIIQLLENIDQKQDRQSEILTNLRIDMAEQKSAFISHLKQDESMYDKIKNMDDKLGDYNLQLAEHIAGVQELRKMNQLLKQEINQKASKLIETEDQLAERLSKLESPIAFKEKIKKAFYELGKLATAAIAFYAMLKIFFPNL